ncbi:MAG: metallophosphoesterase [Candidatus Micrarchaeaceae archaeon]
MKIAITSDFHLGYERFYEDAYIQAASALESAASEADIILIPGDIFDNRMPKPEVFAEGINIFRNLKAHEFRAKVTQFKGKRKIYTDAPIIAIPGTHERRSADVEDPVELLNLAGLLVNASEAAVTIESRDEKVSVFGLGGISEERVRNYLRSLDPKPEPGSFNIFMFHQSVYELMPFSESFLKYEDLPKGFDLYIDGHIHNRIESKVNGKPLLIPGSTVLTQLKDAEQESKGFFLYDTKSNTYKFVEIHSRPFVSVKLQVGSKTPNEIKEAIENEIGSIAAKYSEKPVIRIVLEGKIRSGFSKSDIDIYEIIKENADKAFVEISRQGLEDKELSININSLRSGSLENISIKDFGLSVFLESIKKQGYSLKISPTELFEILSGDSSKEKIVNKAMGELF